MKNHGRVMSVRHQQEMDVGPLTSGVKFRLLHQLPTNTNFGPVENCEKITNCYRLAKTVNKTPIGNRYRQSISDDRFCRLSHLATKITAIP